MRENERHKVNRERIEKESFVARWIKSSVNEGRHNLDNVQAKSNLASTKNIHPFDSLLSARRQHQRYLLINHHRELNSTKLETLCVQPFATCTAQIVLISISPCVRARPDAQWAPTSSSEKVSIRHYACVTRAETISPPIDCVNSKGPR